MPLPIEKTVSKEALAAALAHPDAAGKIKGRCPKCDEKVQGVHTHDQKEKRIKGLVAGVHIAPGEQSVPPKNCEGVGKPLRDPIERG